MTARSILARKYIHISQTSQDEERIYLIEFIYFISYKNVIQLRVKPQFSPSDKIRNLFRYGEK